MVIQSLCTWILCTPGARTIKCTRVNANLYNLPTPDYRALTIFDPKQVPHLPGQEKQSLYVSKPFEKSIPSLAAPNCTYDINPNNSNGYYLRLSTYLRGDARLPLGCCSHQGSSTSGSLHVNMPYGKHLLPKGRCQLACYTLGNPKLTSPMQITTAKWQNDMRT